MGGDAQGLHQREVDHFRPERDGGTLDLVGGTGIVDQRRDHAVDVALRLLQRLADVRGLQRRQLILVCGNEVGEAQEHAAAGGGGDPGPVATKCVVGRADGGVDVGGIATGDLGDRLLRRGIEGGEALAGGRGHGTPGDDEIGLHGGVTL